MLDERSPEEAIRKETAEETGYVIQRVMKVFEAFMSPGSVTEKLHFFIAEYDSGAKQQAGGGLLSDGEDIETFELNIDAAMEKISFGEIRDGKTIMVLQYAKLHLFG